MDVHSREQYLDQLREEYRKADKKTKTQLLNEARKRTRLNRKVLIRKLAHPALPARERRPRGRTYGVEVIAPLVKIWEIFDYPCGQRLAPALRENLEALRGRGTIRCRDEIASKLNRMSARTMDRLLAREKQVRCLRRNRSAGVHPLLYQKIPVKVASEWDTKEVGNLQVDYVEHCGRSAGGQYLHTLSAVDIASGWWEPEAITARSQAESKEALDRMRKRLPFRMQEIHPDNDTGLINDLLWRYCRQAGIKMSRSRPYKKNDNAWIEQRNWSHVRQVVGYARFDTTAQLAILRELYACLRLYKNFFQPTMKLLEKVRSGGKIHRKYDQAKTPYARLMESGQLSPAARKRLAAEHQSLDVADLRNRLEQLKQQLFATTVEPGATAAKTKRRWTDLRLGGRAYNMWMRKMIGPTE
jgi:hypothetical protein